jgi:hypothetical protein
MVTSVEMTSVAATTGQESRRARIKAKTDAQGTDGT